MGALPLSTGGTTIVGAAGTAGATIYGIEATKAAYAAAQAGNTQEALHWGADAALSFGFAGEGVSQTYQSGAQWYQNLSAPKTPSSLGDLQSTIDTYAIRANRVAWDKGLSGPEAGNYVDRYMSKAIGQLDSRLVQSGSDFRAFTQYGMDVNGNILLGNNRPSGSLFLDAVITDANQTTVFSGWDARFQSTPYPRWNTAVENANYVQRFQIQEGFVREISVEGSKPQ
jgi:hypothetical protein